MKDEFVEIRKGLERARKGKKGHALTVRACPYPTIHFPMGNRYESLAGWAKLPLVLDSHREQRGVICCGFATHTGYALKVRACPYPTIHFPMGNRYESQAGWAKLPLACSEGLFVVGLQPT